MPAKVPDLRPFRALQERRSNRAKLLRREKQASEILGWDVVS
jgi:hypothetical protein